MWSFWSFLGIYWSLENYRIMAGLSLQSQLFFEHFFGRKCLNVDLIRSFKATMRKILSFQPLKCEYLLFFLFSLGFWDFWYDLKSSHFLDVHFSNSKNEENKRQIDRAQLSSLKSQTKSSLTPVFLPYFHM